MSLDEPGARPPLSTHRLRGYASRLLVPPGWQEVAWGAVGGSLPRWASGKRTVRPRFTPAVRAIWVAGLSSTEYTDEAFGRIGDAVELDL